jgi:hypothetical protein
MEALPKVGLEALLKMFADHAGATGIALAWEMQLLAASQANGGYPQAQSK